MPGSPALLQRQPLRLSTPINSALVITIVVVVIRAVELRVTMIEMLWVDVHDVLAKTLECREA